MAPERPLGIGCMRLSTESERDQAGAIDLLHTAFDSGVTFLDTLDPSPCIYVGSGPQDRSFARRLGFEYRDASDFLALG